MKLTELRRNPELNPRQNGHKYALDYLKNLGDLTNYGVSMTRLPKLGINPRSGHNTPIGVYFYPADYYLRRGLGAEMTEFLPFAKKLGYIQILKFTGNVLYVSEMTDDLREQYYKKLYNNADEIARLIRTDRETVQKSILSYIHNAHIGTSVNSVGGEFWNVLHNITGMTNKPEELFYIAPKKKTGIAERRAVIWNYILRNILGIDVVVDRGEEIIHTNEPCQGVVLNPAAITHVKTITNKEPEYDKIKSQYNVVLTWLSGSAPLLITAEEITYAGNSAGAEGLSWHPKYAEICDKIINIVVNLVKSPAFYEVNYTYIHSLLKLTKDKKLVDDITNTYFFRKVPMLIDVFRGLTIEAQSGAEFDEEKYGRALRQCVNALQWMRDINSNSTQSLYKQLSTAINDMGIDVDYMIKNIPKL